jgi:hypothetical protein
MMTLSRKSTEVSVESGGRGTKRSRVEHVKLLACKKIQRFWRKVRVNNTTSAYAREVLAKGPTLEGAAQNS